MARHVVTSLALLSPPPRYFWWQKKWLLSLDIKLSLTQARVKLLSVYSRYMFQLSFVALWVGKLQLWVRWNQDDKLCEQLSMKQNLICSDPGNVVLFLLLKAQSCFSKLVLNNSVLWSRRAWGISEIMHAKGWLLYSWCLGFCSFLVWCRGLCTWAFFVLTCILTHPLSVWIDYVTQIPPRDISLFLWLWYSLFLILL